VRGEHAHRHADAGLGKVVADPFFLFGNTKGDQQNGCAGAPDISQKGAGFGVGEEAVVKAADTRGGVVFGDPAGHVFRHARLAAQQIEPEFRFSQHAAELWKEIGAVDVLTDIVVQYFSRQLKADTVGQNYRTVCEELFVIGVVTGDVHAIGIDEA
jgi:hypothetical protein